jgi:hypothetical protein
MKKNIASFESVIRVVIGLFILILMSNDFLLPAFEKIALVVGLYLFLTGFFSVCPIKNYVEKNKK